MRVAVFVTPLYNAEIVTLFVAVTLDVVIVKVGEAVAPPATVTDVGTTTPPSLLDKVIVTPPGGAGPVRLILFNVVLTPPLTAAGDSETADNAAGLTVRMAVLVTPLYTAEIVIDDMAETDEVVIVNAGDAVAPAATVTDAGGTTPGSLLVKVTLIPPAGAGPVRFTLVKVEETPPTTDAGEGTTDSNATGLTVRTAVLVTPL